MAKRIVTASTSSTPAAALVDESPRAGEAKLTGGMPRGPRLSEGGGGPGGGGSQGGEAMTRRALGLGIVLVAFVAGFTPYNDNVLQNSPFIGNHFPIGIVTLMTLLMLAVNPLLMFWKKRPLGRGELIVIMTMMLVGAAVPSSGLMRYLEPMVVSVPWLVRDFAWLKPISELMPTWLTPAQDAASPIVTNFQLGIDPARGGQVPVAAFLLPALIWGVLIAAVLGGSFFLAALFRRQWVHHERLTFPLATIPLELMATPEEGKYYNALWRNPVLWAGAAIPLLVYLMAGLHSQWQVFPGIDLQYNISEAFSDRPWDTLPSHITQARVYLAAVGICFFIPSEIAFSMWFFLLLNGLARVFFAQTDFKPAEHEGTRAMGTYLAYFAGLLWLARGHFKHVLVAAWKKSPRAEDEPLSYRTMVVGWGVCMAVAWVWLMAVGMSPLSAMLLLGLGTMLVTLMARIVAETGLFFVGPIWWPNHFFSTLLGVNVVSVKSFYWSQITSRIFYADLRETLMPFASNALRMGQEMEGQKKGAGSGGGGGGAGGGSAGGKRWVRWLGLALLVSLVISGAMHHWVSYSQGRIAIPDDRASRAMPFEAMQDTYRFEHSAAETDMGTSWKHAGGGAMMAAGLMVGRVLWAGWPFHPIGLVLMGSGMMHIMWFSIFIGWSVKRLLLRYGGAGAFRRARPFFIGLIVGEMLSAGGWMFVGLATNGAVRYTLLPA